VNPEPLACAAALAARRGVGLGAFRRNAAAVLEWPLAQRVVALGAQPDLGGGLSERRAAAQCLREARRRAWTQRGGVAP
jgi:hypothetical protein